MDTKVHPASVSASPCIEAMLERAFLGRQVKTGEEKYVRNGRKFE